MVKKKRKQGIIQKTFSPKMKNNCKYKDALISTLISLGGIYATFFTFILIKDSDATGDLFKAQSLLGGLFVNFFAVIGVAYSKFAKEMFVHKNVYWLSMASFLTTIFIFAQARIMNDTSISFIADWLESPCVSIALQLLLAILIFAIAAQKELSVRISYNKKKLI